VKPLEALRALGAGEEAPAEAKQRVYGALLASLEVAAAAAVIAPGVARVPGSLPPVSPPLLAGIASSKALLVGTGIWLLGGATGALIYGALHPQQVRVVYVDRPVFMNSTPRASVEAPPSAAPASLPSASPSAGRAVTSALVSSAAGREGSDLAAERALLDSARSDAAHGEPAQVLEQVARHQRQFPHGHLIEEREALAIRALLALGRSDEAKARAAAFRAAYPHSFLTPVIDSALSAP
jgi:hypothetical protein